MRGRNYPCSSTGKISSATSPCASRWTAAAASAVGASTRQKIFPAFGSCQYFRYRTPLLRLRREVLLVRARHVLGRCAGDRMDVHEQRHVFPFRWELD